jgi:hypothetical protein
MCLIIHKLAGVKIPEENYEAGFDWNDDGFGIARIVDNVIQVDKGFAKFKKFYKWVESIEDDELLIHFRRASPGMVVNQENCHPFKYESKSHPEYEFAMVHNGKLNWHNTKEHSDTLCFAEGILWPTLEANPKYLEEFCNRSMLKMAIGTTNKMVILRLNKETGKSDTTIINAEAGMNDLGCWFSNDSYKPWTTKLYGAQGSEDYFPKHELPLGHEAWYKYAKKLNPVTKQYEPYEVWVKREREQAQEIIAEQNEVEQKRLQEKADATGKIASANPPMRLQAPIEVTRDPGVLPKDDGNVVYGTLNHLTNREKKALKKIAWDFWKSAQEAGRLGPEARLSVWEAISFIRSEFKESLVGKDQVDMASMDRYIIDLLDRDPEELAEMAENGPRKPMDKPVEV